MGVFLTEIPETLLPYPKEKIEEALVTAEKHFASVGDKETARILGFCRGALLCYVEDKKALESFLEKIKNKEFIEKFLEVRKKYKKTISPS